MLEASRRRAEETADALRQKLHIGQEIVDPAEVAKSLGIVVNASEKLGSAFSGCLMLEGETFGILYSSTIPNDGFRRFTISHELGHHRMTHHQATLFENGRRHLSASNFVSVAWHEVEADAFAAAFLMPQERFSAELRQHSIGKEAVKALAATFLTSYTSTAIRYARLCPDPAAVIVSEKDRILYCFTSEPLNRIRGTFIRKDTRLPSASRTAKFNADVSRVESAAEDKGFTYLSVWFENPETDFELYEDIIGLGKYGKTLTILHAEEIPDERDGGEISDEFTPDGKRYRW